MQLPDSWVKSLFARLQVRYGSAWNRMWDGVDMDAVMADWADELGGFANNPDAIKRALANLPPDRPPTLGQFRAICIGAPGDVHDKPGRLEAPSTSPEVVAAIASALDYAHNQGLLHRDVKPANIMLTDADDSGMRRILLADFGIARAMLEAGRRPLETDGRRHHAGWPLRSCRLPQLGRDHPGP